MPVFTPINPPPPPLLSAEASAIEAAVRPTASEHIEERIRDLVQEYQEALWTWAKGLLGDALKSLKSLSGDALICTEQEPHIESECNAYCAEYGGVSMTHLRFLVFSNLGYAYVAAAGEQSSASLFASGLGGPELDLSRSPTRPGTELSLHNAMTSLTSALRFSSTDSAPYLTIGHCAMLLGQLDAATSAFCSGLGSELRNLIFAYLPCPQGDQHRLLSDQAIGRRFSPFQWWCVKAIIQASLMRCDVDTALSIGSRVAELCPALARSLCLPVLRSSLHTLPCAVALPAMHSLAPARLLLASDIVKAPTLSICSRNGRVSLVELGAGVFELFELSTSSCSAIDSAALYTHVEIAFCEVSGASSHDGALAELTQRSGCTEPAPVSLVSGQDEPCAVADPPAACTTGDAATDFDKDLLGSDEASTIVPPKCNKRRESLSGDEIPAKRRSTRFMERTTSGVPGSTYISGASTMSACSNPSKAAATRGSQQNRTITLSLDAVDSSAYHLAIDSVGAWLETIGAVTKGEFSNILSVSTIIGAASAVGSTQKVRTARGAANNSGATLGNASYGGYLVEWGLVDAGDDSLRTNSSQLLSSDGQAEECNGLYMCNVDQYRNSLDMLLKSHLSVEQPALSDTMTSAAFVSVSECQATLAGNSGAVDLLLRFVDTSVARFYSDPDAFMRCKAFKQLSCNAVWHMYDVLLGIVGARLSLCESPSDFQYPVQQATFITLLLADAVASQPSSRDAWASLHKGWTRAVQGAIAVLEDHLIDEPCLEQYRLFEAWTCYEIAVLANDISGAASHIAQCVNYLGRFGQSSTAVLMPICAFSGARLTVELAKERQQHLVEFERLAEAFCLAEANDLRAAELLSDILVPFSTNTVDLLSFSQRVSATRQLALLYRRHNMAPFEARMILYEIHLYLTRLLECCSSANLPVRAVFTRCVQCLKRLYDIAESDDDYFLVRQCADKASIERGLKLLLAQLLSMSMSVAHHFALNPVVEYSLQMVESEFVGLATWLATKLGLKLDYAYQAVLEDGGDFAPLDGSIRPLSAIHDLLGERGVCTAASGAFMKQLLSECRLILEKDRDNVNAWDIAAACLRCLYDIRLHGSDALGHVCEHFDMDLKSANSVYLLVEPGLVEAIRNRKGAGLRSDFKTIVDKAGIALGELDVERHPRLSMNVDIIDNYLDGTSMPSFVQIDRALRTSAAEFPDLRLPLKSLVKGGSIPVAFRSLPFVRAAIQHELILVRMRSGATRAVEDYDEIIEDYKLNIALGAEPSEAWCHLGRAYADLADEMLLGTASEITECKYDIASLQRLSLSCAAQANQQLPVLYSSPVSSSGSPSKCLLGATAPEPTGKTNGSVCHAVDVDGSDSDQGEGGNEALRLHVRIKALTGHLLYRIAAKPLSLLAFHVLPSNVLVSDDGSEAGRQWDLGKWGGSCDNNAVQFLSQSLAKRYVVSPPSKRVYALARIMFAQATVLDPANWEWSYMLGKVTAKLGNSLAACALYLKACHSAVAASSKSSGTGASAHSHLLQVGVSATTGISAVHAAIPDAAMDPMYKLLASLTKLVWSSRIVGATAQRFIDALPFSCTPSDDCVRGNPRALETSNPETAEVFSAIRCAVAQMCASDKRRRHHRPQFLLSWIDHHVLGESERAKQTLVSSLLQMRNSTKQLASFYKTDFEAPGKHYIYLEKYLALYVETLVATFDISGVQLLLRKLGRSSDSLYNPVALQCQAVAAELNILQRMALNLNCPKFVVDGAGKEHIILQGNLDGSELAQIYSITRHCRLHRFYFNHARDILRDNISFFMAQREITRGILSAGSLAGSDTEASAEPMRAETGQIQQALDEYLAVADKSIVLFEHLLDQKRKLSEEPEALHRLNDCLADVYMLVLSVYGQRVRVVQQPPISAQQDMDEALVSLRNIAMLLAPSQSPPLRTEGTFWHNIIFDEMRHEPSQQYRLLDSLLEFQVNKLLDAVREASQPKPNAFSERPQLETAQPAAQSRQSEEMPMSFAQPQALPTHLRQPP